MSQPHKELSYFVWECSKPSMSNLPPTYVSY